MRLAAYATRLASTFGTFVASFSFMNDGQKQTVSKRVVSCQACGHAIEGVAKFCPQCGYSLSAPPPRRFGPVQYGMIAGLSALIFTYGWLTQSALGGKRPERSFQAAASGGPGHEHGHDDHGHQHSAASDDPQIKALKAAAEAKPGDKEGWRTFVTALYEKLQKEPDPANNALLFEIIDGLRAILKIDPKDPDALLAMADVSFNQQAFPKAAEFYSAYLDVKPDDVDSRARYASSLTFLGRYDDSIVELKRALVQDPKSFHASAYLAITYAQMGKAQDALQMGEEVMKLAPSDEARARFGRFLDSVKEKVKEGGAGQPDAPRVEEPAGGDAAQAKPELAGLSPEAELVVEHVRQNSVAGPKLTGAKLEGAVLTLSFASFPMDQMPPGIRDKFVGDIRAKAAATSTIHEIVFFDSVEGRELQRVPVKAEAAAATVAVAVEQNGAEAVIAHVRNNPVAGPKFAEGKLEGGTLILSFDKFPMDQMPPGIRDKFVNGIKEKAVPVEAIKSISFVDKDGGKEMVRVEIVR